MLKMSTIICATDLSLGSNQALPLAAALAHGLGAKLIVAHTVERPIGSAYSAMTISVPKMKAETEARVRPMVEAALKEAPPVDWELNITIGFPAQEIYSLVEHTRADMLVAATRNKEGLERLLLGSFTRRLLHSLKAPILVVPGDTFKPLANKEKPIKSILLATDFSENAGQAVNLGLGLAEALSATAHLVTVMAPDQLTERPASGKLGEPATVNQAKEDLGRKLEALAPSGGSPDVVTAVLTGRPHEEITKYALDRQIDLIIMGTRGAGFVEYLLVGSTTDRVVRMGRVPVLAVRT